MADWILTLSGHRIPCEVLRRRRDVVRLRFAEAVTIKPGRWGLLVTPDAKTRIAVEIGLPKSPTLIECSLLGTFAPAPSLCLECGATLRDSDVVRRVPGMGKKPARELCPKCWEREAAREFRASFERLALDDFNDDDVVIGDETSHEPGPDD